MHILADGSYDEKFYFAYPVLFYVSTNDIDLMCPIVGNPFLLQNAMIIKYNLNKCMISAHLYNAAQSRTQVNLQVSYASADIFWGTHYGTLQHANFDLPNTMHQKLHLSKLTTFGRLFYGLKPALRQRYIPLKLMTQDA